MLYSILVFNKRCTGILRLWMRRKSVKQQSYRALKRFEAVVGSKKTVWVIKVFTVVFSSDKHPETPYFLCSRRWRSRDTSLAIFQCARAKTMLPPSRSFDAMFVVVPMWKSLLLALCSCYTPSYSLITQWLGSFQRFMHAKDPQWAPDLYKLLQAQFLHRDDSSKHVLYSICVRIT